MKNLRDKIDEILHGAGTRETDQFLSLFDAETKEIIGEKEKPIGDWDYDLEVQGANGRIEEQLARLEEKLKGGGK